MTDTWTRASTQWLPSPRREVQDWCDEFLRVPETGAYLAGPWDTERFAHQRGIMWLWSHHRVVEVDCMWGTRLGKSALIPAKIAWAAVNDPGSAMVVCPDITSAKKFYYEKLMPVLLECKETRDLLPAEHRRAFPTVDLRHMLVHFAWSGSVSTLGDRSVRYLFATELDKWSTDKTSEADAEPLADERTKDWPNAVVYKECTPTLEGSSRIEANLKRAGVVLEYHVPCPHCARYQVLKFSQVKWEGGSKDSEVAYKTAHYVCVHCDGRIDNTHRRHMLRRGVWAPADHVVPEDTKRLVLWGEGGPRRRVGTHLSSLYSPTLEWGHMAEAFLRYKDHDLQNWVNSWEARTWRVVADRPEWQAVEKRLSTPTPRSSAPGWTRGITVGVDIGKHRNHAVVRAWGERGRSQLVEEFSTDNRFDQSLGSSIDSLCDSLATTAWHVEDGTMQEPRAIFVDSGYATSEVYAASRRHPGRVYAVKGSAGSSDRPLRWTIIDVDPRTGNRYPGGLRLVVVDVDYFKNWIFGKLGSSKEDETAWLLHSSASEEYMRSICSVIPVPEKDTKGRQRIVWRVLDADVGEHYNDAEVYASAAAYAVGLMHGKAAAARPGRPQGYEPKGKSTWKIGR